MYSARGSGADPKKIYFIFIDWDAYVTLAGACGLWLWLRPGPGDHPKKIAGTAACTLCAAMQV